MGNYKIKKEQAGIPTVSILSVLDDFLSHPDYSIFNFERADEQWLDFVISNRTNPNFELPTCCARKTPSYGNWDESACIKCIRKSKMENEDLLFWLSGALKNMPLKNKLAAPMLFYCLNKLMCLPIFQTMQIFYTHKAKTILFPVSIPT